MIWLILFGSAASWFYWLRHAASTAWTDTGDDHEVLQSMATQDEALEQSALHQTDEANQHSFVGELSEAVSDIHSFAINPANGLPMVGDVDIAGNIYGTDSSHDFLHHDSFGHDAFQDECFISNTMFDDTFSSSFSSSFDD